MNVVTELGRKSRRRQWFRNLKSLLRLRMCDPDPSSYGSNFSNLCAIRLVANSPDNNCFCLLVGIVESWIHDMSEIFPKTSAGVPNAYLEFERTNETRMHAFADDFIAECNSTGLSCLEDVSRITFGRWRISTFGPVYGMITRDK